MEILIVTAMDIEIEKIRNHFNGNAKIYFFVTGIGFANASTLTKALENKNYDLVLNIGVSGSLVEDIEIGKTYSIDKVYHYDIDITALGLPLGELSTGKISEEIIPIDKFEICSLASGSKFVSKIEERKEINKRTDAVLCDMETAVYAKICKSLLFKFSSIRTVSDSFSKNKEMEYTTNLDLACDKLYEDVKNYITELYNENK